MLADRYALSTAPRPSCTCNKLGQRARCGGVLEAGSELDEYGLAPGRAEERQPDRQAAVQSRRNGDVRVPRDRGRRRAAAGVQIAVDVIGEPCGPVGERDDLEQPPGSRSPLM